MSLVGYSLESSNAEKITHSEDLNTDHLKTELFEVRSSNGLVFKMVGLCHMFYGLDGLLKYRSAQKETRWHPDVCLSRRNHRASPLYL